MENKNVSTTWNNGEQQQPTPINPAHYQRGGIECIEVIKAVLPKEEYHGFLHANAIKYLYRAHFKGHLTEDLEKAQWYLKRLINEIKAEEKEAQRNDD